MYPSLSVDFISIPVSPMMHLNAVSVSAVEYDTGRVISFHHVRVEFVLSL